MDAATKSIVSIRAPVMGAIPARAAAANEVDVSIRAPVMGAMTVPSASVTEANRFQSAPP